MHGRDPASVYRQRWRWNAVQTAHQGYPLIGISTVAQYSLRRDIGQDQSNLQYRGELLDDYVYKGDRELINPSLHRAESILVSSLALLSCIHPTNVPRRRRRPRQKGRGRRTCRRQRSRKERTPEEGTR